jgi:hypothetical protein
MLNRLAALDPTTWGLDLSAPMLRATWQAALNGFRGPGRSVDLRGVNVLLVGSANVYTALLPWMVLLTEAGASVRVKPARGQRTAITEMATAIVASGGNCVVAGWKGGEDLELEKAATDEADAVIAFGNARTLAALGARSRAPVIGFGPRFGVNVLRSQPNDEAIAGAVRDVAFYDSRGCMSPAGVFVGGDPIRAIDGLAAAMAEAEARWPVGAISGAEATAIRARVMLTRATGGAVRQGPGWTVLYSPDRFEPIALPRVLSVHPISRLAAVLPYAEHLGTVAGDAPELPALRRCAPGEMQTPGHDGTHEGVDVIARIAGLNARSDQ